MTKNKEHRHNFCLIKRKVTKHILSECQIEFAKNID